MCHIDRAAGGRSVEELKRLDTCYLRAIEAALEELEKRGPCIGDRLRGSGLDRFCRTPVRTTARQPWRIV